MAGAGFAQRVHAPSGKELAARFGLSESKVSRLKDEIEADVKQSLQRRWREHPAGFRKAVGIGPRAGTTRTVKRRKQVDVRQSLKEDAMHLDESRSKPERRRKAREQYERKGSLVQGGLPRMAGGKEIELEDGMITCETNAAVATPARTVRRLQRPKRAKSAKRVRVCPLPEQYAEVLNCAGREAVSIPAALAACPSFAIARGEFRKCGQGPGQWG